MRPQFDNTLYSLAVLALYF